MNRLLQHLGDCPCRRRQREAAQAVCDQLQELAGDVIEASCRPLADDADHRIHIWLAAEIEPIEDYAAAHSILSDELRRVILDLSMAVERLEGGAV